MMPNFLINGTYKVEEVDQDAAIASFHKYGGSRLISIDEIEEPSSLQVRQYDRQSFTAEQYKVYEKQFRLHRAKGLSFKEAHLLAMGAVFADIE